MMFVVAFFFAITSYAAESFYDFTPRAQSIAGQSYPRNGMTLYRGTTDHQMDLSRALRALLGDPSAYVESLFFSTIKNRLMEKPFPVAVTLNFYLEDQIRAAIAKNKGALSEVEAVRETKRLVDGTFQYLEGQDVLIDRYVNYQSGSFIDWPQDVVFTTIVSPVAGTYGNRMLVIREKKPRSLDMNFWNKVNQDIWFHYTRDAGEFIAFGYLNPEDLIGYQVRSGHNKNWHFIETAFYKVTSGKTPSVLVFSGQKKSNQKSTCIDFNAADKALRHCDYRTGHVVMEPPQLEAEKPQLLGVIVLCPSGTSNRAKCDPLPESEIAKYPVVSDDGPASDLEKLEIQINGKAARFFRVAH